MQVKHRVVVLMLIQQLDAVKINPTDDWNFSDNFRSNEMIVAIKPMCTVSLMPLEHIIIIIRSMSVVNDAVVTVQVLRSEYYWRHNIIPRQITFLQKY